MRKLNIPSAAPAPVTEPQETAIVKTTMGVMLSVPEYNRLKAIERGEPNAADYGYDHPDRCKAHERVERGGSYQWSCHKKAGHPGVCSAHVDCGRMSETHVVCGFKPEHDGPCAWESANPSPPAPGERGETDMMQMPMVVKSTLEQRVGWLKRLAEAERLLALIQDDPRGIDWTIKEGIDQFFAERSAAK